MKKDITITPVHVADLLAEGESADAFGVLFDRHHRELLGFFVRRTADAQVAADLTAEFYADTVRRVFMDKDLAKGSMTYNGKLVRPDLITCPIIGIEGVGVEPGLVEQPEHHPLALGLLHQQAKGIDQIGLLLRRAFHRLGLPRLTRFELIEHRQPFL